MPLSIITSIKKVGPTPVQRQGQVVGIIADAGGRRGTCRQLLMWTIYGLWFGDTIVVAIMEAVVVMLHCEAAELHVRLARGIGGDAQAVKTYDEQEPKLVGFLARNQQLVVFAHEPTIVVVFWPRTNDNGWCFARNQQLLLIPGH